MTVWLVEDSATDAFVVGEALKLCGFPYALRVFSDRDSPIALVRAIDAAGELDKPDIVLLDLNVPKAPGIEVLSALRKSARCANVPVVVVTSSDSKSDLNAISEFARTSYFRKPHDLDQFMRLSDVIRQAVGT